MKIFKKGEEFEAEAGEAQAVAAPPAVAAAPAASPDSRYLPEGE